MRCVVRVTCCVLRVACCVMRYFFSSGNGDGICLRQGEADSENCSLPQLASNAYFTTVRGYTISCAMAGPSPAP